MKRSLFAAVMAAVMAASVVAQAPAETQPQRQELTVQSHLDQVAAKAQQQATQPQPTKFHVAAISKITDGCAVAGETTAGGQVTDTHFLYAKKRECGKLTVGDSYDIVTTTSKTKAHAATVNNPWPCDDAGCNNPAGNWAAYSPAGVSTHFTLSLLVNGKPVTLSDEN